MKAGIYQIVNTRNNKRYIGSTLNFRKRYRQHERMLKSNKHDNQYLQNSFAKEPDVFVFQVIETINNAAEMMSVEQGYLDVLYDRQDQCYNINPNANQPPHVFSAETKRKMSAAKIGSIPWNKGMKGFRKGIPRSEETKRKISETKLRNPYVYSDEQRKKMSDANKGRKAWNAGAKGLQIAWNKGLKGVYKCSAETRAKMSKSHKAKRQGLLNPAPSQQAA